MRYGAVEFTPEIGSSRGAGASRPAICCVFGFVSSRFLTLPLVPRAQEVAVLLDFVPKCKELFQVQAPFGDEELPAEARALRELLRRKLLGFELLPENLVSWQACMQAMFKHFGVAAMDQGAIDACFPEGGVDFGALNRRGEPLRCARV